MASDPQNAAKQSIHGPNPLFSGAELLPEVSIMPERPKKQGACTHLVRWVFTIGIVLVVAAATVGAAVGITMSQGNKYEPKPRSPPPPPDPFRNMTVVKNKFLTYIPLDARQANTEELIDTYTLQLARTEGVSQLLAFVLPAMGLDVQPQAIQIVMDTWLQDNKVDTASLGATIDSLAQMAQGVMDYQSKLVPIASNLANVTVLVRTQVDRLLGSTANLTHVINGFLKTGGSTIPVGRRTLADQQRVLQQALTASSAVISAAVESVLSSSAAAPLVTELRKYYDPASLPQLVADMYTVAMRLTLASDLLRDLTSRMHTSLRLDMGTRLPIYNPSTGANMSTIALPVPFNKRTAVVLPDSMLRQLIMTSSQQFADNSTLLKAALMLSRTPQNFTGRPAVARPRLLVPLVFHILVYSQPGGTYGPPNYQRSPQYVARMLQVVNDMALPANVTFFVHEVRYDPVQYPYLARTDRNAWQFCVSDNRYFYEACRSTLDAPVDFPRSINVFVVGDKVNASYSGYGWVPASTTNFLQGHVMILWSVLDASQWNSQTAFEYGAAVVWHELLHHLGLIHNFGKDSRSARPCSSDSDDDVADTPRVSGPVSEQNFSLPARAYCLDYFQRIQNSNWSKVRETWRTQLGIPVADTTHNFDSCPFSPGNDEIGNYITYTHDVCTPALGHITRGQADYLHIQTARYNGQLYVWSQYFASLVSNLQASAIFQPPPSGTVSLPQSPLSTISVTRAACRRTRSGCHCRDSWTFRGRTYNGCANPDDDPQGLWCIVELDGNCPSAINGFWDYCNPNTTDLASCYPQKSGQAPSPPSPSPPSPVEPCGAGWTTQSGAICSTDPWVLVGKNNTVGNTSYIGCANPDNDPKGSWCRLKSGTSTLTGRNWDFCGEPCATSNSSPTDTDTDTDTDTPPPASSSCSSDQGLPPGCTCRPEWGVVLQQRTDPPAQPGLGKARRYETARNCTAMEELDGGLGLCEVTGCNTPQFNGRVMVCTNPCTRLSVNDGEDVLL